MEIGNGKPQAELSERQIYMMLAIALCEEENLRPMDEDQDAAGQLWELYGEAYGERDDVTDDDDPYELFENDLSYLLERGYISEDKNECRFRVEKSAEAAVEEEAVKGKNLTAEKAKKLLKEFGYTALMATAKNLPNIAMTLIKIAANA